MDEPSTSTMGLSGYGTPDYGTDGYGIDGYGIPSPVPVSNHSTGILVDNPSWGYLGLAVIPLMCIMGNSMVMAAVFTTKSLQTPTNHLLVRFT